ncbi:MAG: hypothetical protein CVV41_20080 [Candidatus Riflebacteria bacterium HGW-Riflebacteria-1]|jgi:glycosyltransferase involved in cell wall biosynthesis|nr:MAG: hypothetical protein CVV41_20080 [Candidatus Riflebacteria bacterium HGW-Riflebacteria-1]
MQQLGTRQIEALSIRHTVLMITYNQEKYIRDALNSVFEQDILPLEVVISDDASTDRTCDIIKSFEDRFPNIIRLLRNKENLGIYNNLNRLIEEKFEGDVISFLAGDDMFSDGLFASFNRYIEENGLNPRDESFILITQTVNLYPDGTEKVFKILPYKKCSFFKLLLRRGGAGGRCTGFSKKLFDSIPRWKPEVGLWADYVHQVAFLAKCESAYYLNQKGPFYRIGPGITGRVSAQVLQESYLKAIRAIWLEHRNRLDIFDRCFLAREIAKTKLQIHYSVINALIFVLFSFCLLIEIRLLLTTGIRDSRQLVYETSLIIPPSVRRFLKTLLFARN